MALPTTFITKCDSGASARLEAAVRSRYGEPLYERVTSAGPETVDILLKLGRDAPLWVADAPRHAALSQSLAAEFGDAAKFEFREREQLAMPYDILHLRVNPAAQHDLFERHLQELPEFIGGFFPIIDPESGYRIVLDAVKPEAISNPYTTAWCIDACFRLVDDSGKLTLDRFENYGFGRFWEPVANGRGKEQYGRLGRPYDEVARLVRDFLQKWCGHDLPECLRQSLNAGRLSLKDIFDYEGA